MASFPSSSLSRRLALLLGILAGAAIAAASMFAETAFQTDAGGAIRLGDIGRQLSERDVDNVSRVLPAERKPWLLIGELTQTPPIQIIQAYLPPESVTPTVRRGSMAIVRRNDPATDAWFLGVHDLNRGQAGSYAQVAIPGRGFDGIVDDQDHNRPFSVTGNFTDAELVRIAAFVRSNPSPSINSKPIVSVVRLAGEAATVWLRRGALTWDLLTLRPEGEDWALVASSFLAY